MNNKYLIILFIIPAIILCNPKKNNKEDKTIINNGVNYKINNSSNHISPLKGFKKIEKNKKIKQLVDSGYKFYTTFGHLSPLGENLRSNFDPSYSIGFILDLPQSFSLFKKDWEVSVSTTHARFKNNNINSPQINFSIFDFMTHTKTKLGPILLNLGLGIVNGSTTTTNNGTNRETSISAKFDVGYYIIEKKDFDLILNMSFQLAGLGPLHANDAEKATSELMGLNLQFGKSINF